MLVVNGAEVRRLRLVRGWSQRELGVVAGVRQATISSIENGAGARPSTVRVVATALGVSIEAVADVVA